MILRVLSALSLFTIFFSSAVPTKAQETGAESITASELRTHLQFIAADELAGRNAPSTELKITSRYLAAIVESYGFQPLMSDGSFLQHLPLEVRSIVPGETHFKVSSDSGEHHFSYPQAFGLTRFSLSGRFSGEVVFVGYGLEAPDQGWDDYGSIDLTGKVVVMLEGSLPADHLLRQPENRRIVRRRSYAARERGAAAVINVISEERETEFRQRNLIFQTRNQVSLRSSEDAPGISSGPSLAQPFHSIEVRHDVAAALLGVSGNDLSEMFAALGRGEQLKGKEITGSRVEGAVSSSVRDDYTSNVVAFLPGSDPVLKDEYVLFGAHHDHLGVREGRILNGADDNGSGSVALLELAQAFSLERPKRSVVMVWHTAEEKGLWGAEYFMEHSPIAYEKMSAELNLDMICRNDPESLYLIGSDKLSTRLDAVINSVNDRYIHLNFDYTYNDNAHPDRFFFRSDHYPYIQYGIPAVWFFCGTTEDYHQETDSIDRVDFKKMERVARLVYLVGFEIANMSGILELDAHPQITSRGAHNLQVRWRQ
jgi:Zn-dependent M28 family amino/carboxypeptidase